MKSDGYDKTSLKKHFLFSGFFANLYYFFVLHIYLLLSILGVAISIAVILFFAEMLFPKYVHLFNYSMSDKVFSELVTDHKYHEAIAFMETKKDMIKNSDESYRYRQELADCYIHTGDYPKALEQYRLLRQETDNKFKEKSPEGLSDKQVKNLKDLMDACFLKEEFRIYLKMGDLPNIRKYSELIRNRYNNVDWENLFNYFSEEQQEKLSQTLNGRNFEDGFRLELIQGKYLADPKAGIEEMEKYAIDVANSRKFNQVYKLRLFNELLRMLLEQNDTISARYYLEYALTIVDSLEYNSIIYSQLGELSDYCYQLNDIEDGRRLLKKYLSHINDTYDESDIEYALAHAKEFKYLQAEGNWNELYERAGETSKALREQISSNFTGMTSAQREYFVNQFMPVFDYVNNLVEIKADDKLAIIAFDNNMFLRGLLLRSESALGNAIAAMNDKELLDKYNRYVEASKELVSRQYVSGPGNYIKKQQLEKEIGSLESELANKSMEFRRENADVVLSASQLRKSLDNDDVVIQIIEGGKTYYALVLDKSGTVKYAPIGDKIKVAHLLDDRIGIYTDFNSAKQLLASILPVINGKDIYLTPTGVFNKMSLAAFPIESNGKTLGDVSKIHLVISPTVIPNVKSSNALMDLTAKNTVLWGGIKYGSVNDSIEYSAPLGNDILRGEELRYLPGSLKEVTGIAELLRSRRNKVTVITADDATEKSLIDRSGQKDYILHISTHGFFHDSDAFENPMQNSGLLFANSQKYWMNDSIASTINESDGILRADEIANLDLSGCHLVVLSACQTGLGLSDTDGVYGLQRAFKLAGAESIVMSLWSVDDAATRELMILFYSGLLNGQAPDESLTSAKNQMRRDGYSHDKWAAFVLLN